MELIYVWIDEYKNIKKQGFNFSAKFNIEYEYENKKLTIEMNEKNVNIFPNNINVCAIVGQNGSGKTSFLEALMLLVFKSENNNNLFKGFAIFFNEGKFYISYKGFNNIEFNDVEYSDELNIEELGIIKSNNKYYFSNQQPFFVNFYYNPSLEMISNAFLEYTYEGLQNSQATIYECDNKPFMQNNLVAFPFKKYGIIDIKENENFIIKSMFKNKGKIKKAKENFIHDTKNLFSTKIFFSPTEIIIKFNINLLKNRIINSYKDSEFIKKFFKQFENNEVSIIDLTKILLLGVLSYSIVDFSNKTFSQYFFKKESVLEKFLTSLNDSGNLEDYMKSLISKTDEEIRELLNNIKSFREELKTEENEDSSLNIEVTRLADFIDHLLKEKSKNNWKGKVISYTNNFGSIEKVLSFVPLSFEVMVYDENGVLFNEFSFGEKMLISLLNVIIYCISLFKSNSDFLNIFIDEMEIGLNPEWQRKLIKILVNEYSLFFPDKKINFFIATHSPFILSDIPKENVIFLDNGESKNKFKQDENIFGANIYDIFEKGFFLENSIGKYSEEWIKALDLLLSFFNAYKLANEKESNVFPLRNLLKRWYVVKNENGELSEKEIEEQDKKLLSEKKEELLKALFEKTEIEYKKFKFLIDEEFNLKPEIEDYINIIGDEIVRNHLLDLYKRAKNESK